MSLALSPVVGTIRIEPLVDGSAARAADDSSLGTLLADFAHRESLAEEQRPIRLIAAGRLSRSSAGPETQAVRADLVRLIEDLEAEYDELQANAP